MTTKIGKNQAACLRALKEHGGWPGGWIWTNRSETVRLLDSLVKRGLVTVTEETIKHPAVGGAGTRRRRYYQAVKDTKQVP